MTQALRAVIALALAWQAIRPHVMPAMAEAAREPITVNVERIGGRYLTNGVIPVQCADLSSGLRDRTR